MLRSASSVESWRPSFSFVLVRACVELKQPEQVQLTLSKMDERLQDLKSLAGDKKDRQKSHLEQLSGYWGRTAQLAELQQRKLDAPKLSSAGTGLVFVCAGG